MPDKIIKLPDVPRWIRNYYPAFRPTPSRQTIYNWRTIGRGGQKLRTHTKFGRLVTTEGALHEFINNL